MAEDPYKVLGVARDASDDEIRRVYRKLAKELHPDLNPVNRTAAEERFKRVSAAYEIVGDAEKRKKYDRGEIDANGEPQRAYHRTYAGAGGYGGRAAGADADYGFGDIFSDLFNRARGGGAAGAREGFDPFTTRGRDVRYTLEVDFLEAVNGAKKRVTMPDGGTLDLSVPEGVTDGQVLRLTGKGMAGVRGMEPGDALVEIKVRAHPAFTREGDDIRLDLPITIDEAVLGGKIEVPTVSGRVQLTIPKGTSSGRVFRLKGKGVRNLTSGSHGDQLVTVRIVLPEKIDDEMSYFFSEWKQKHQYDPGRG
ncbi:MAG: DnaJ C-terminal domain-containing protein [Hyphomicrobiaceae bacterium]|nr:DnaJ C-terminal domain-containing protein [Hyphomicrobiaceae bacterium]